MEQGAVLSCLVSKGLSMSQGSQNKPEEVVREVAKSTAEGVKGAFRALNDAVRDMFAEEEDSGGSRRMIRSLALKS